MEETFRCDWCKQEIPLAQRSRDEAIFAAGWTICTRCEPVHRQHLAQMLTMARRQWAERLEPPPVAISPETQRKHDPHQQKEAWTFPHVVGSTSQQRKRYRGLIDTYTASYMRWQNKAHVLAWLDSFQHQQALRPVFLDTETTGTRRFSEVIEICIVNERGQTLFHSLVNPTTDIEPMASAVHGLTHREVKDAPRFPEIYPEVMSNLHDRIVIAYNASFDIRLLKQTAECYELAFPALHVGCLMYAYTKYREEYVAQSNGRQRYKTHRLEEALAYERLNTPPLHRAERDAQCVYRLFQAMKTRLQLKELW